jgi:hypothetical protein
LSEALANPVEKAALANIDRRNEVSLARSVK